MWGGIPAWASAVAPPAHKEWPATLAGKCWHRWWMNHPWVGTDPSACNQSWGWNGKRQSWDFRYLQKGSSRSSPEEFCCTMTLLPSKNLSALWPGRKKENPSGSNSTESCVVTFRKSCKSFLSGHTNSPKCMSSWKPTSKITKNNRSLWLFNNMYWVQSSASSVHERGHLQVVGTAQSFLQPQSVLVTRWWQQFFWTSGWNGSSSLQMPKR